MASIAAELLLPIVVAIAVAAAALALRALLLRRLWGAAASPGSDGTRAFAWDARIPSLFCHIARFTDQWAVQDGLRRRILRRFTEEGVEMAGAVAADGRGPSLARSP